MLAQLPEFQHILLSLSSILRFPKVDLMGIPSSTSLITLTVTVIPFSFALIFPSHSLSQYTRLFAHIFTFISILTPLLTNPLHYRLGKNDTPLPLNRRPPAIVYAGTPPPALAIPCLIMVSFLLSHNSPLPHAHPASTTTHTYCTPPHINWRRVPRTI